MMRSPVDLHGRRGEVDDGDLHFVPGTAVVGVDYADTVGDHQSSFQRSAAAREDSEEESLRHLDHQSRRHEPDSAGFDSDARRRRQIEARRTDALVGGQLDFGIKFANSDVHG